MKTPSTTRHVVAYIRVSTEEQATEGYSLDAQERQTRAYAVAREWPEVTEVYADAGVSGATRDRPALNRLLADARAGTIDKVICTKLDRMGRRAVDLLNIETELDECGVTRTYIKDSIDTSTPVGRMLRTVLAAVAELERDMIIERTHAGMTEKARKGEVWRSRGLYGYIYIPVDRRTSTPGRLEIDPVTAPVVQRVFRDMAAGSTANALAAALTSEGIPTPRGGRSWSSNGVIDIVRNPAYIGRAAWGRTKVVPSPTLGHKVQRPNAEEAIIYSDAPALVNADIARTAQAQVSRNRALATRNAKADYLLRGLLICGAPVPDQRDGICGHTLTGDKPHVKRVYRCSYHGADGRAHHHKSVPADVLEEKVWAELRALLLNPSRILKDLEKRAQDTTAQARVLDAEVARLQRAAQDAETQQTRLLDLYLQGGLDVATFTARNTDLTAKRESTEMSLQATEARRGAVQASVPPVAEIRTACARAAHGIDDFTFAERQHIVRLFITRIVATPEDAIADGDFAAATGGRPLSLVARKGGIAGTLPASSSDNPTPVNFRLELPLRTARGRAHKERPPPVE